MIDVKLLIRTAFYKALNGFVLAPDNSAVGIFDDVTALGDTESLYVLLDSQNGTPSNSLQGFMSREDMLLSVIKKDPARVAKSQVDFVASQILAILIPHPSSNGLPAQAGVQFLNLELGSDTYQSMVLENNQLVIRRMLNFTLDAYQTFP